MYVAVIENRVPIKSLLTHMYDRNFIKACRLCFCCDGEQIEMLRDLKPVYKTPVISQS